MSLDSFKRPIKVDVYVEINELNVLFNGELVFRYTKSTNLPISFIDIEITKIILKGLLQ